MTTTKRFPATGAYQNDCPCCGHHNAILLHSDGHYECRDCGQEFAYLAETGEWEASITAVD